MSTHAQGTRAATGTAPGRGLVILGCTGSIGDTTFQVLDGLGGAYRVLGLAGGRRVDRLIERARQWAPASVAVERPEDAAQVRRALPGVEVLAGEEGLLRLAALPDAEVVVNGLVGAVGLRPTLAAVEAGKTVAMANKEPLVMAGGLILDRVRACGAQLLPLDSEPNALWQCLRGESDRHVRRLILTASGGAFRDWSRQRLAAVTPAQALKHPTWQMGRKITVDSATLMNKGFEVLEAAWLFGVTLHQVDVIVHRESIIHSMVEFVDGSYLAHLGRTHMHLPIQYALTQPARRPTPLEPLDLASVGALHFEAPDVDRFPCLPLCYEAGRRGGTAPAALNAANEVAVASFLEGRLGFLEIYEVNRQVLDTFSPAPADSVEAVLAADRQARQVATSLVAAAAPEPSHQPPSRETSP
ncbi:MAG: 1-deoxy-D-xylulose-5-phosphate reductoisomerase [Gemmatimonadota bacterium]